MTDFAYAVGKPLNRAVIRQTPEDFRVEEILGFTPSGSGEHVLLHIQKRDWNTDAVARQLAKFCGIKSRDVSYAGMKDRHAVTTQWFSVQLPGREAPDWQTLQLDGVTVLAHHRHQRKLKRGTLQSNRFVLVLRELQGDREKLTQRLSHVAQHGVPNYFGPQRFGRDNLANAEAMFSGKRKVKDKHLRGIYLSAARAWLFNHVLSMRVRLQRWHRPLPGDALQLDGSHSFFTIDRIDTEILSRIERFDVHPTGPLCGDGDSAATGVAAALETKVLAQHQHWLTGLRNARLEPARRALRLRPQDLAWTFLADDVLQLDFVLPAGSYATSVLRELVDFVEFNC